MAECGPYTCAFPDPAKYSAGIGNWWRCPKCLTAYRLTKPKRQRWWRNWSAPNGHWVASRG